MLAALRLSTHANCHGTTLATLLRGKRVRLTEIGSPITTTDGKDGELSNDDGSTDGGCDFLRSLDPKTDVTFGVANDNDSLKPRTLAGTGLLLDWLDL